MHRNTQNAPQQLNEKLYDDFYVQELETRLETDPFTLGGLIDLETSGTDDGVDTQCIVDQCEKVCGEYESCFIDVCIVEK